MEHAIFECKNTWDILLCRSSCFFNKYCLRIKIACHCKYRWQTLVLIVTRSTLKFNQPFGAYLFWRGWQVLSYSNSPTFYEIRRCITFFTRARHMSLFQAGWIPCTSSHPVPLTSFLILSSYINLSLPRRLSFKFSHQTFIWIYIFPYAFYMPLT